MLWVPGGLRPTLRQRLWTPSQVGWGLGSRRLPSVVHAVVHGALASPERAPHGLAPCAGLQPHCGPVASAAPRALPWFPSPESFLSTWGSSLICNQPVLT